jgi:hypothetical protein
MTTYQTPPAVTFAVDPETPGCGGESIVMTPELREWATGAVDYFLAEWRRLQAAKCEALGAVTGEASWRRLGGHEIAMHEIRASYNVAIVRLLASGHTKASYTGWVTRRDWARLVNALPVTKGA